MISSSERPFGRPRTRKKRAQKQSTIPHDGANSSQASTNFSTGSVHRSRGWKVLPSQAWRAMCLRIASGMMLGARSSHVTLSAIRRHWTRSPRLGTRARVRQQGALMKSFKRLCAEEPRCASRGARVPTATRGGARPRTSAQLSRSP
jgi:hypothetical protein